MVYYVMVVSMILCRVVVVYPYCSLKVVKPGRYLTYHVSQRRYLYSNVEAVCLLVTVVRSSQSKCKGNCAYDVVQMLSGRPYTREGTLLCKCHHTEVPLVLQ